MWDRRIIMMESGESSMCCIFFYPRKRKTEVIETQRRGVGYLKMSRKEERKSREGLFL